MGSLVWWVQQSSENLPEKAARLGERCGEGSLLLTKNVFVH